VSRQVIVELAARHGLDVDELIEAWAERAAIREYLAGFDRRGADLWAIGDVETMYAIGLHCPETRRQMIEGGQRVLHRRSRHPGYHRLAKPSGGISFDYNDL
jgi:hypothetical protein